MALDTNVKVRIDDETRTLLELLAATEERTVGAIIRRAIRMYIAASSIETEKAAA